MSKSNKEKIDFRYNLKVYFEFLKRYKLLFFALISVVFILEIVHILDRLLFKIIVDKGTEYVSGGITSETYIGVLLIIATIFVSTVAVKVAGKWLNIHFVNKIDAGLMRDLKQKFFNHILQLSHRFHTTHRTGSLISRLARGSGGMERMTDFLAFNTLPLIFQSAIVIASLVYFDIVTGIIVFAISLTFIIYSLFIQNLQKTPNVLANRAEDIEKGHISDYFTNIDSIKYFGKENMIKDKFAKLTENSKAAVLKHWGYFRAFDAGQSLILAVGTLLIVYFSLKGFLAGEITLGTLVFVYTVYTSLTGPLFGFVHGIRGFYRSMADFEELFQYGKIENEIKDKENAEELSIRNGNVEFKNVSFNYEKRQLFKDFNLKIKEGEKVAFVGHSGSGKTTIVKLLYRLYDVASGQILIDGRNIKDFKQESLRSELSIVPQEAVLFDDTIYNNIAFSNPQASRKEVLEAMKFAQLDKVIKTFPNKENTIVGERGVKLSGGEKQRVSIARAILANKKVLVLDEATSSLDSKTESEIQKDLKELMKNRTSIIIAHRLSTIMGADKIVVMDEGKIVQVGKHEELIRQKGLYKELWNLQKGGYIE